MNNQRIVDFIEQSFLSELINDNDVTDISYNGSSVFYLSNKLGRKKAAFQIDENSVKDFIRQIANLSERQFSFTSPKLDVSAGRFRINAVHSSIARKNNEQCINFSIRIAKTLDETDLSAFLNAELITLFRSLIKSQVSIVIGGLTGSGKTELQKYLISQMEDNSRIIIIDNVLELDALNKNENLDINIWQSDDKNEEASIQELVKNALRSNPDYLIVAESRGKEMIEVLNSAMTGHPIITTLHSFDANSMPSRIMRMVLMNEQKQDVNLLLQDIHYCFNFYVFLERKITKGRVKRYIKEIVEIDQKGCKNQIYCLKNGKIHTNRISKETMKLIDKSDEGFMKLYGQENDDEQ